MKFLLQCMGILAGLLLLNIQKIRAEIEDPKIEQFLNCLQTQFDLDPSFYVYTQRSNLTYYNLLNRQWNKRKAQTFPLAYFVPKSTFHVQFAVKCGFASKIPLIPNSGGHSYECLSYGDNFSVIVDFREMNKVEVSEDGKTSSMQAGTLLGPMIAQLWRTAKVSLPVGNCLTVGIGGHAVGGGAGFYAPRYGMVVDTVLEYEMVDAQGNAVIASATQNPDLYWGIRGMGAGYLGIVTNIKMKNFRADNLALTWFVRIYPTAEFVAVMTALQNWMEWVGDDHSVLSGFYVTNDNYTSPYPLMRLGGGIQLGILHISDPNDLEYPGISQTDFLRKARQIFPNSYKTENILTPSYLEQIFIGSYLPTTSASNKHVDEFAKDYLNSLNNGEKQERVEKLAMPSEEDILNFYTDVRKEDAMPRYFKAKSQFVKRKLSLKEMSRLASLLPRIPNNKIWIMINSERGAVGDVPKNATSYVHRDSLITLIVHVESPEIDDIRGIGEACEWQGEWFGAMDTFDGQETYQNYPDLDIPYEEAMERYFASNLPQLIATKAKWDPDNYFRDPISIPLPSRR